jgi:hypothetical protein
MLNLNRVREAVHHRYREDFAITDFPDREQQVDDGLFQPEVFQSSFISRTSLAAHFPGANDLRRRFERRLTGADAQMRNPTKVDRLQ